MKQIKYYIGHEDIPIFLWRIDAKNNIALSSNEIDNWTPPGGIIVNIDNITTYLRQIPKKEAKSLFPKAFK